MTNFAKLKRLNFFATFPYGKLALAYAHYNTIFYSIPYP